MVTASFEISILKTPLGQSFMLLSRNAHLKQNMSHIRSTTVGTFGLKVKMGGGGGGGIHKGQQSRYSKNKIYMYNCVCVTQIRHQMVVYVSTVEYWYPPVLSQVYT